MGKMHCVWCQKNDRVQRFGSYRRRSDCKTIPRFRCQRCQKTFSKATLDPEFGQKKRRINYPLTVLLGSAVSMRRAAIILNVHRHTIARRLSFLGEICREKNKETSEKLGAVSSVQFDELQTIEHSKCKPLSVAVAVSPGTRHILGFTVSKMPATGHLAKIARKKYGFRPDERQKGLRELFQSIEPHIEPKTTFRSDDHPYYPPLIAKFFPKCEYLRYTGKKSAVSGQGELKKTIRDPLFYINHTLAMLRANINRLVRKTWCTTKKLERLADHLAIYTWVHNHRLIPEQVRV